MEVVAGPSSGFRCTFHSTNESQLPLTLGRVPPCGLLFNDSEVSGKHAMINWNSSVQMFLLGLVHFFLCIQILLTSYVIVLFLITEVEMGADRHG